MEICPAPPIKRIDLPRSIITIKNAIRLDHDESCNCCCCSNPQPACFKYMQPPVPKSFKPTTHYKRVKMPMESSTTHKFSYWRGGLPTVSALKPFKPEDSLTVGEGQMTDDTTHKLSYLGNWSAFKKAEGIAPWRTAKQWIGRGPMQDATTHKNDFTWKCAPRSKPVKNSQNIYFPSASMTDDTTYKMSYYASNCQIPVRPFKPKWSKHYKKSDVPMEGCTTYKLSYWPNEMPIKENHPWRPQIEYTRPSAPIDDCTIYRMSYWPNHEPTVRKPFSGSAYTENLLNVGYCFDDNTTYNLSYYGCGAPESKRQAIKPVIKPTEFSNCPLTHDTIHKLSYLGNWRVPRATPHVNSPWRTAKQWMGRGPMQNLTTQKHDFTWKRGAFKRYVFRPQDNIRVSQLPLECCTTHNLSFYPNDVKNLIRDKSYKPRIDRHDPLDVPMEKETTMRLSYQPVDSVMLQRTKQVQRLAYHPPLTPIDDNTTYNQTYIPPGILQPLNCDKPMSDPYCVSCSHNPATTSSHSDVSKSIIELGG